MMDAANNQAPPPAIAQCQIAAANAAATSPVAKLRKGFLTSVQPVQVTGAVPPPGRYFARILFLPNAGDAAAAIQPASGGVLWEGYLGDVVPASIVGIECNANDGIVLQVWSGTNGNAADSFAVVTQWNKGGQTALYIVPPGTGAGELVAVSQGPPAAGSDFQILTPGFVRRQFIGGRAILTTSAAAGNRLVHLEEATAAIQWDEVSLSTQAASLAYTYSFGVQWARAAVADTTFVTLSMPPVILAGVMRLQSNTTGLLAGDQWSGIHYNVLEWAMPAP